MNPRFRIAPGLLVLLATLLAPAAARAGSIEVLTRGDRIDVRQHLVPGRAVLFDFFADWCGPCRSLNPTLERLAGEHAARLTVRKIDIVRWGSPVAEQYRINGIPHLKLFGPDGNLVAEGSAGEVLAALERLLPNVQPSAGGSGGGSAPVQVVESKPPIPFAVFILVLVGIAGVVFAMSGIVRRGDPAPAAPMRPRPRPSLRAEAPADSPDRTWWVFLAGVVEGPYTPAEMEELRRGGRLPAGTPVRKTGDTQWRTIGAAGAG